MNWSRREWLTVAAGCAAIRKSVSTPLPGFYYRDYSKCLPDYLRTLAAAAYQKRNRSLSLLTDPAAVRSRQHWARQTLWKLIGDEPARTPLKGRVIGHFERAQYWVEKVIYESRPGLLVSANLYIPKAGKPPYPGVLFQMGHSIIGKAYGPYQKCCQGLAQLGYVVLAFDPMGQGERVAYPDASEAGTGMESEHDIPGKQLLLLGDSATRYQLWDATRSLDYLAEHPMVNPQLLAATGQSGGATITMLLACADDRLKAAAISSGNTENFASKNFNPPGATDDAEQDFIGSGLVGFDRWDLVYPFAPKPLLIQVSTHDFFGTYSPNYLDDAREEYAKLAGVYALLGQPDHVDFQSTPLPHGLTYELRLDIYNWFERWLKNSDRPITQEPSVSPEPEGFLQVGPTGNVSRDYGSLRPFELIKEAARTVARKSASTTTRTAALPFAIPTRELKFNALAVTPLDGVRVEALEVNSAASVWIPAWLFRPGKPKGSDATLLVLDDRGRNALAHEDDVYHSLARSGELVCAADLRGIGDLAPEVGRGNPGYTIPHNSEEEFAWASLILGDPLLSQRITDILALARALRNESVGRKRSLALAARGRLTVPALFAFATSPEIDSLYLAGGLVSFQKLLESETYTESLANFAWDLFRSTDLPLLAAESSPRRIYIAGSVGAANNTLSVDEVRRFYSSGNVTVSDSAAWNELAFREFSAAAAIGPQAR